MSIIKETYEREGWTFEVYPYGTDLLALPSETVYQGVKYSIERCRIAYGHAVAKVTYFVDWKDKDNCIRVAGMFPTEREARERVEFLMKEREVTS